MLYVQTDQLTTSLSQFISEVLEVLQQEIVYFDNHSLSIKPSIGYAIKQPNKMLDELMHEADQQMYEEKSRIKQRDVFEI